MCDEKNGWVAHILVGKLCLLNGHFRLPDSPNGIN